LVAAGAKMAQTPGPIGSAIGAGIQAGVGQLEGNRKELRSEEDVNLKAQQLYQQAKIHLDEYNRIKPGEAARLGLERERLEQDKYKFIPGMGPDGSYGTYKVPSKGGAPEFIPGMQLTTRESAGITGNNLFGAAQRAVLDSTSDYYRKPISVAMAGLRAQAEAGLHGNSALGPQANSGKPESVTQNGFTYHLQPDGSYK